MTTNNPMTWADGYGLWHASVPISTPQRQAIAARLAIRSAIGDAASPDYRLRVTRERVTGHGTVIYREV